MKSAEQELEVKELEAQRPAKEEEERLKDEEKRLETDQLRRQELLKKELIEILPKLHPKSYPVKFEDWTNQYGKQLLDEGKFIIIEQSLPIYRQQLAEKLKTQRLAKEEEEKQRLETETKKTKELKQKLSTEISDSDDFIVVDLLDTEKLESQRLETEITKTKQIKSKSLMKLGDNHDVVVVELNGLASDGNWHLQFDGVF